ncbi:putative ABC transporter permease [Adlercreutzia caecimuris]|jgi:uncharacterized membrane protein|uniref:putative ABC transporter permease n=1 Tax=Adlercreutzia caecimuris TaxID=671266 RepID=UPI000EBF29BA|nr:putative ABC transporter permease [Adlercreutzia caecimuris]
MAFPNMRKLTEHDEIGYFALRTWEFWRALIVCFCLCCILGHWLEMPYCWLMDQCFGIVADDYAVWTDPWYHPYWVYGFGAVFMTLLIEPLKERLILHRKTLWGAFLESLVLAIVIAMVLELVMGWLINQPDPATGEYPFWDNSQLPGNVFGQAWLVNDFFIGLAAMIYVWVIFPLVCEGFSLLSPKAANIVFALIIVGFIACVTASYLELRLWEKY